MTDKKAPTYEALVEHDTVLFKTYQKDGVARLYLTRQGRLSVLQRVSDRDLLAEVQRRGLGQ